MFPGTRRVFGEKFRRFRTFLVVGFERQYWAEDPNSRSSRFKATELGKWVRFQYEIIATLRSCPFNSKRWDTECSICIAQLRFKVKSDDAAGCSFSGCSTKVNFCII